MRSRAVILMCVMLWHLLTLGGSFLYVAPHEARDGMADFKQQLCDYKMPNATVEYVMACVEEVECPAE